MGGGNYQKHIGKGNHGQRMKGNWKNNIFLASGIKLAQR